MSTELATTPPPAGPTTGSDHGLEAVPLSERKGPLFMGLLWITMVTGLSTLNLGVGFHQQGLTLAQTLQGCVGGAWLLLAYTLGAAYLGTKTGLTYAMLARIVFGRVGTVLVSAILVVISLGWYGFQATFLAQLLDPLLGSGGHLVALTLVCGLVMGITNYFGFSGVAGYARFVAAPLCLLLVLGTVWKAFGTTAPAILWGHPAGSVTTGVIQAAGVIVGFGIWGNEPDFWRFGKPRVWQPFWPLAIAMALGLVLFPAGGWVLAAVSGANDVGPAAAFLVKYLLGGSTLLAIALYSLIQVSNNDPNLYEAVNAFENVTQWPRRRVVVMLWALGILAALGLSKVADALFLVSGVTSVLVPTGTVIMMAELLWLPGWLANRRRADRAPTWSETDWANWPAIASLVIGGVVGVYTNGSIPHFGPGFVGIPPLQAWGSALASYALLAWIAERLRVTKVETAS
jgi:purine-cytosine permease-like protein